MIRITFQILRTLFWINFIVSRSLGKRSEVIHIPGSFCGAVLGEVSGVEFRSSHQPVLSACSMTLDAGIDTNHKPHKFIVTFGALEIESCDVYLSLYNYVNTSKELMNRWSCNRKPEVAMFTTGRYLTIDLENRMLRKEFAFRLTVTAYSEQACDNFLCSDGHCIDSDLLCDNIKHCVDGSDESVYFPADCSSWSHASSTAYDILRIGVGAIVGLVAAVTISCVVVSAIFLIWYRRRVHEYKELLQLSRAGESAQEFLDEEGCSSGDEQSLMYPYPCSASGPPTYTMETVVDYGSTAKLVEVQETAFNGCKV